MFNAIRSAGTAALMACALLAASCSPAPDTAAQPRTEFNIGWSIYAGWMPWPYAQQAGIVKKWADKYGLKINFVQVNDYVESVNQYTAGKLDGVTVANMDALTIPAAGGKDTSAIIVGDYSNGNDGILLKNADSLAAIKGRQVYLVELSVSHYLLARGLQSINLPLTAVSTVNTSDADIVGAFAAPAVTAAVSWNPQLSTMKGTPGAKEVFSSADIPGEILDLMVVDTSTLKANPNLGKALAGIWYETTALMQRQDAQGAAARAAMAKLAGANPAGVRCAAQDHLPVRRSQGRGGGDILPGPHRHHDPGARLQLLQGPVRARRAIGRRGGHFVPERQDAGRCRPCDLAFRSDLHADGRRW